MKKENECTVPAGTLLIIGGKENKGQEPDKDISKDQFIPEEILKCFVSLIGKEDPVLEVVTSGSSDPEESFQEYKNIFSDIGVKKINHVHHAIRKEVIDQDLEMTVDQADAFFFTGGDQLLLTSLYGGSNFLRRLKERYIHENLIIAGTSAGAMAMSTPMIYAGSMEVQQLGGEIKVTTGLEFLKDVCIDTHFVDRGRFVRMAQVIATNPSCIGLGIEEDTAVILRNGLEAEVIGSGIVIIVEGFELSQANMQEFNQKKTVSIRDLRVHMISKGDTYRIPILNPRHQ